MPSTLDRIAELPPRDLLAWAIQTWGPRFAVVTSFQDEGMAIVDMAARLNPSVRILTIDTGRLPAATLEMIRRVHQVYGIEVEVHRPDPGEAEEMIRRHGLDLFHDSVSRRRLCCEIRKVRPLDRALAGVDAWASGLRRAQSAERGDAPKIDDSGPRVKLNPLAEWTDAELAAYLAVHQVPRHPLYAQGYSSIGCEPCTRPGHGREGRWWWEQGAVKECGLHFMPNGRARREVDILLEEILNAQRLHTVDDGHVRSGQEHRREYSAGTLPPGGSEN